MNERIKKLRDQSVNTVPSITAERAVLITDFYQSEAAREASLPIVRARSFQYIMAHKSICINEGELIVGERGPAPKVVPTYPELTCHSLRDLELLDSREKISYKVDEETRKIYRNKIIPFWKGRSVREKIFGELPEEWKSAYDAGIFTEFMEQRAPGHTVLDDKIYSKGMLDFKNDIQVSIENLDLLNDPKAFQKREELRGMEITADALITLGKRHAQKAMFLANSEKDPKRKEELLQISEVCDHVPANAPRTMQEALQYYWFVHLGVITELNPWDAFNPGKLDKHIYPFYKKDLEDGRITKEDAVEMLQNFWIKFNNQPAPPKVGVTAEESATYTDFAQINSGGLNTDGTDCVNELSYLILDVIGEMHLTQPSPSVQISRKTPDSFLKKTLEVVRLGTGQPSIFNTDTVVKLLVRQGKTVEDALDGGTSGCIETGAFGKENYNLTGYFNMVKVAEIAMNNGVDVRTGKQIGPATGNAADFKTFDDYFDAYKKQMAHFIDIKMIGNNIIERIYADYMPVPFLSMIIDDCITTGTDYHAGGARYNVSYIQGVGLGTLTDLMVSIKHNVFEKKKYTFAEIVESLHDNFKSNPKMKDVFLNKTPKYGNDDDYADNIMKDLFEVYFDLIDGRPNTKGGEYRINLLPTTCHIYFGSVVGATPDGRNAFVPLSEGVSPVQGSDKKGPTSVVKSVSKMDHIRTGGTLLNMKFLPELLETETNITKLSHLVRTYFKLDGHHIQFNVVDKETLLDAQRNPQNYQDLIVRVAGYSDYFVHLGKSLQDEIINRTAHEVV